jgi:cephalosporin hydroxylase
VRPYTDAEARVDVATMHKYHRATLDAYHQAIYHARHTWGVTKFEGVRVLKTPQDLWTYHEWIHLLKPTLIIETGTAYGGSALYFARQMQYLGGGHVITIDVEEKERRPKNAWITYEHGSSLDSGVLNRAATVAQCHQTMVVLDSRHDAEHVRAELDAYAPLVSCGQLLVVEDTNISHPELVSSPSNGPAHALADWLPRHPEFEPEILCERWGASFFPGGWLRRVS